MNPSLSLLDGVPFAINPIFTQCKPKPRELNPNYNLERAKSILNTELDLSVETKVLTSQFRSKFTSSQRKKSFSFYQPNTAQNLEHTNSNLSSSLPNTTLRYSNVPLEPVKHSETFKSSSTLNNNNNDNNFNDLFDNSNALDPFDDLELKTLNDLEELKKILTQNDQEMKSVGFYLNDNDKKVNKYLSGMSAPNTNNSPICAVDNFGLPKLTFYDLNDSEK